VGPVRAQQGDIAATDDLARESLRFARVYGIVEQEAMAPPDPDRAILDGGIRGMLATLDPFSSFFDKEQFELLQQQTRGEAVGFGSILYLQAGKVLVLQTARGSPSWRAGLGPGDEIVEVNGTRINRLDLEALVDLLRRSRTRPVRLGVIRPGGIVPQDIALNPARLESPTIDRAFLIAAGIGYVHLTSFDQKTTQELFATVNTLGGAALSGLLLDLRDNPGGVLDSAIATASMFLPADVPVLSVRGRSTPEKNYRTLAAPARFNMPLVVLVNGNTASAAEVVAAALQEHDRAVIAGEMTYGKGVVESVFSLSDNMGLMLTAAQYFTPSGRSIHRPRSGLAGVPADNTQETSPGKTSTFRTMNGRPLTAGGGITPDVIIPPRRLDPWLSFLNLRGAFTEFGEEYVTLHRGIDRSFEPDEKVLGEFKEFLERKNIRVPEENWARDLDYLRMEIKAGILTLVFGLAVGEEIETRADPQVQKAVALFPEVPRLLKPPTKGADSVSQYSQEPSAPALASRSPSQHAPSEGRAKGDPLEITR
jgi:carboxyl-terminal processing protease